MPDSLELPHPVAATRHAAGLPAADVRDVRVPAAHAAEPGEPRPVVDPRIAVANAARRAGQSDREISRALSLDGDGRSLRRLAGSRRSALAVEHPTAPTAEAPATPAPEPDRTPPPPPKPQRRRSLPYGWNEDYGQRVEHMSGDLPWSPERLRAATDRKLQQVAAERAKEYGFPQMVVTFADGSARVMPVPQEALA